MTPPAILVIYAHAAPHASRVNRLLAQAAGALPRVLVHDLYERYPDFYIDVAAEQALLAAAGHVVFVHPIQWYSMPALLKEWVDVVLQAGWAYGKDGKALAGKTYWLVTSTGSPADAYSAGGAHGRPFDDYLPQFRQTAALCGMRWEEPLVLHGAHLVDDAALDAHVAAFVARLEQLSTLKAG
jgi:glutathione-regulated potassium-efflux system ancillary protein KefF